MLYLDDSECFPRDSFRALGDKGGNFWVSYFFKYLAWIAKMSKLCYYFLGLPLHTYKYFHSAYTHIIKTTFFMNVKFDSVIQMR